MTPATLTAELEALDARPRPCRRFSVTINAGGDTREALVSELRNIVSSIAQGGTGGYTGGHDAGSNHELVELPDVTGESYMAALKEWLKGEERRDEIEQQLADLGNGQLTAKQIERYPVVTFHSPRVTAQSRATYIPQRDGEYEATEPAEASL